MFDALAELALDPRGAADEAAVEVWRQLDPVLWERTGDAWTVLRGVSREKIGRAFSMPGFHAMVRSLVREWNPAPDGEERDRGGRESSEPRLALDIKD